MKKRYDQLDDEDLARIVHEAHLALRIGLNDSSEDVHWDALPDSRKKMVIRRVRLIREGATCEQVQQDFIDWMIAEGWKPGPRDVIAKTHPYILPYSQLPPEEKAKVRQAVRIVFTHVMPEAAEPVAHPDLKMEPVGTGWRIEEEELPEVCVTHGHFYPCGITDGSCVLSSEEEEVREVYRKRYGQ